MAVPVTYRYKWKGVDLSALQNQVNPSTVVTPSNPAPVPCIDITLSLGAGDKVGLDQAMDFQGWAYDSTNPPAPPQGIVICQSLEAIVTTDQSTTSNSFADVLSQAITTSAGFLQISTSISSNAISVGCSFRLTLDGVAISNGGAGHDVGLGGNAILKRVAISAGVHTVALQYKAGVLGTVQIRPASTDNEHASLWVEEVSG